MGRHYDICQAESPEDASEAQGNAPSGTLDWDEPEGWPSDARRDRLIGSWHIYQRHGGHRTSTDDLITAWYASHRSDKRPERYLDLGCGIGSVLLMVSHKLAPRMSVGVEAQPQSALMATRSVEELPADACSIEIRRGDFRSAALGSDERFDLITGSPPYFPLDAGVLPQDAQRRACRFEARGGVEDYLATAKRHLSNTGRFYLVFQSRWNERALTAADQLGLHLRGQADFHMRRDRAQPFLSVFEFAQQPAQAVHRFTCPVREADNSISEAYQAIREELGLNDRPL